MIDTEIRDGVVVVRFAHGKASALDTEFLVEIARTMEEVEAGDAKACVLTGTGKIFSAGVDLKRFIDEGTSYLNDFMPALDAAFTAMFAFEKPMIAACNGHAIAGGCVILSCCDLRFVAAGPGRIGVPELQVGVPFPLLPLEIMRFALPNNHVQEVLLGGRTYKVEQAQQLGLCDDVVEEGLLMERAMAAACQLASYPREAFRFNKRLLRRPVLDVLSRHGAEDNARALELWQSASCQQAVRDYVAKTLG